MVVAAPCESLSAEEAEGQEEGGEEADHPEYRQGRCNTNNINIAQINGGHMFDDSAFGHLVTTHSTGAVNRF